MASTSAAANFHAVFNEERTKIESLLAAPEPKASEVASALAALRKEYAAVMGALPSYDQRQYDLALKALEGKLATLRAKDKPRGKFTFSKKTTTSGAAGPASQPPATTTNPPAPPRQAPSTTQSEQYSLSNLAGQRITPSALPDVRGEYTLSLVSISDSVIDLRATTNAGATLKSLHASKLERCVLITDGMAGSAMLHDCLDCILVLGAHQFRMHTSHRCRIYLHVTSAPVIEHSTGLCFAPYPATVPVQPSGTNRLAELADFDWVRGSQSPNWRRMSEDEVQDGDDIVRQLAAHEAVPSLLARLLPAAKDA